MKTKSEIDAWMAALEWTPETAESCITDICVYLKSEQADVWLGVVPHISAGLECLADNPDELYRLAAQIHNAAPTSKQRILATILASVNAALPVYLVQTAVMFGALVPILANRNYTLSQRLAWIKEHTHDVLTQGGKESYKAGLETPIKDALALKFFMVATSKAYDFFLWGDVSLPASEVATMQFLEMNAPNLVGKIDLVMTLGLSYADAVDMLIDAGDGKQVKTMLDLPGLDGTQGP
jgi:hypothetical protein